jgi:serine/threonine-protein kinase SRPK3
MVLKKIGKGSFATVWLAYHINRTTFHAIKIHFTADFEDGEKEVEFFKRVKETHCKYLNQMEDHFIHESEEGEHICMVFKLMGGSLYDLVEKGKYVDGLPYHIVKNVIHQSLVGLQVLHNDLKVIHTDIKPENILFNGVSNKNQAIINKFNELDFDKIRKKNHKKMRNGRKNGMSVLEMTAKTIVKQMGDDLIASSDDETDSDVESYDNEDTDDDTNSDNEDENENENKNNDDGNNDSDDNECVVDDIYVNDCQTVISDFGSCCAIATKPDDEIQTRYYRAPEIILKTPYSENCDIWSIGCLIYELLTGDILFEPNKMQRMGRDKLHIREMMNVLGRLPDHMINESHNSKLFFKKNGLMKWVNCLNYIPLSDRIRDKLNQNKFTEQLDDEEFNNLISFLYGMLEYDPAKRFSVNDCLNHSWMKDLHNNYLNSLKTQKKPDRSGQKINHLNRFKKKHR